MPLAENPGDLVFQVVVNEQRLVCIYMPSSDWFLPMYLDSESDTTMTWQNSWCLTYESSKMIAFISDCVRESTSSMASTCSATIILQWETELLHKQLPGLHPRWHSYDRVLSILYRIITASIWNLSVEVYLNMKASKRNAGRCLRYWTTHIHHFDLSVSVACQHTDVFIWFK